MSSKNKQDKNQNAVVCSELAIRHNLSVVEYCRTSMAALSGCTAGVYQCFMVYLEYKCCICRSARLNWPLWSCVLRICCYKSVVYGINESRFF